MPRNRLYGSCLRLVWIFANLALFFNIVIILGALSALQATLTLPGIAGIVLTIGMAVDANVLVQRRIEKRFYWVAHRYQQ